MMLQFHTFLYFLVIIPVSYSLKRSSSSLPHVHVKEYGNHTDHDGISNTNNNLILMYTRDDLVPFDASCNMWDEGVAINFTMDAAWFSSSLSNNEMTTAPMFSSLLSVVDHFFKQERATEQINTHRLTIITNGFLVSESAGDAIFSTVQKSFGRLRIISTHEFYGYAVMLNMAIDYLSYHEKDKRRTSSSEYRVAIADASFSFQSPTQQDIFQLQNQIVSLHRRNQQRKAKVTRIDIVTYISHKLPRKGFRWMHGSSMPLLIFDISPLDVEEGDTMELTKNHFFDDAYFLHSYSEDFIQRAEMNTFVFDASTFGVGLVKSVRVQRDSCQSIDTMHRKRLEIMQNDVDLHFIKEYLSINKRSMNSSKSPKKNNLQPKMVLNYPSVSNDLTPSIIAFKVCAVFCVYDDTKFFEHLLRSVLPSVHHALILISGKPWNGPSRPTIHTLEAVQRVALSDIGKGKVSVINGSWESEKDQRNFGNLVAKELGSDYVMVIDGDEFWDPVQLERVFSIINTEYPPFVRSEMSTHFGTLSSIIQPPEKLQILWLLSPKSCSFSDAREISCIATEGFSRNGLFLKPNIARCYHLSYVRTTKEVTRKLGSFEHYDEVVNDWIDEKWLKWRNDPTIGDLHPTNPHVYRNTSFLQHFYLPSSLRQYFARKCIYNMTTDVDSIRNDDIFMTCEQPNRPNNIAILDTSLIWKEHEGGIEQRNKIHINQGELQDAPIQTDNTEENMDEMENSLLRNFEFDCTRPKFLVLIVKAGNLDKSSEGTFKDIRMILIDGIRKSLVKYAGYKIHEDDEDAVLAATCDDLRFCRLNSSRFTIVLGSHHLSSYVYSKKNDVVQQAASIISDFPPRSTSVLYNFEFTEAHIDFNKKEQNMWNVFDYYDDSRQGIWDYSLDNYERALSLGINTNYMPLGYSEKLLFSNESITKDIDVLFFGFLNEYRENVITNLRRNGIQVYHVNGIYGEDLNVFIARSKIILNLNFFSGSDDKYSGEWKMPRFIRPLANGILVISDRCGSPAEIAAWHGNGIIFVDTKILASTIRHFLVNTSEANKIAEKGKQLFQSQREEDILWPSLRDFVQNKCPMWG